MLITQAWSMDLPKLANQEVTEWFNTILMDTGVFRPEASVRGLWIGLQGEFLLYGGQTHLARTGAN